MSMSEIRPTFKYLQIAAQYFQKQVWGSMISREQQRFTVILICRLLFLLLLFYPENWSFDWLIEQHDELIQGDNAINLWDLLLQLFVSWDIFAYHARSLVGSHTDFPHLTHLFDPQLQALLTQFPIPDAPLRELLLTLSQMARAPGITLTPQTLETFFAFFAQNHHTGAHYTQTDLTLYLCEATILPYLFFRQRETLWPLAQNILQYQPDRHIPESLRDPSRLMHETQEEQTVRLLRYQRLKNLLIKKQLSDATELVSHHINLLLLTEEILKQAPIDVLLRYYNDLRALTILDPTCGSGAFLLSTLPLLEQLYTCCWRCVNHQLQTNPDLDASQITQLESLLAPWREENALFQLRAHIIRQHLYGVDLMPEAAEVCRFLLTLHARESLPTRNIHLLKELRFQIRDGNTLVGDIHACSASPSTRKGFHWHQAFPEVMSNGGFRILLANPPYSEVQRETPQEYGNLYAATLQRILSLSHADDNAIGCLIPVSFASSNRFHELRQAVLAHAPLVWLAHFDIFPARLFESAYQRLTFLIMQQPDKPWRKPMLASTRLHRWYNDERANLLELLQYTPVPSHPRADYFPKIASSIHAQILAKLAQSAQGTHLGDLLSKRSTEHFVYYQEATNYWLKAVRQIPFYKKNGILMQPTHGRLLHLRTAQEASFVMALLNSSLFYLWFVTYSDGFHLAHSLVRDFPLPASAFSSQAVYQLACLLEEDIQKHTTFSTRNTRKQLASSGETHQIELAEYHLSHSKYLLDAIDQIWATIYNFTSEEIQFIINYDLKYRMGSKYASSPEAESTEGIHVQKSASFRKSYSP